MQKLINVDPMDSNFDGSSGDDVGSVNATIQLPRHDAVFPTSNVPHPPPGSAIDHPTAPRTPASGYHPPSPSYSPLRGSQSTGSFLGNPKASTAEPASPNRPSSFFTASHPSAATTPVHTSSSRASSRATKEPKALKSNF